MSSTVYLPKTNKYNHPRQWKLKDLWELSNNLNTNTINVDKLWNERYAKVWCWQHENEELNNEFFLHHMQRVLNADLNYPIILSEEYYILDGVHRLMKCKYLNIKDIKYVQFIKDPTCYSETK
tara:strand:+ start:81 stop:449 length:369 start_codon:yes stop_codon:yes gene_type:complete